MAIGDGPRSCDDNCRHGGIRRPAQKNVEVLSTSSEGVTIDAESGANHYIIDMGSLAGAVTIDGTSGPNEVTINAPPSEAGVTNTLTLTESGLTSADETINLNLGSTLTELAVDGGNAGGRNQLVVEGTPPAPLALENVVVSTTTTVASSAASSIRNAPVTFAAFVTAAVVAAGIPAGEVQFQVDGADLGEPVPLSDGSASFTTSALSFGTHNVAACYLGCSAVRREFRQHGAERRPLWLQRFLDALSQNLAFALGRSIPMKFLRMLTATQSPT